MIDFHMDAPTADSRDAFHVFRKHNAWQIRWLAETLAGDDEALARELVQAGLIALWRLDASRFSDDDALLLLTRLRDRMKHARRAAGRASKLGGCMTMSRKHIEATDADMSEPRRMRRAREDRWNPQDPCTEHF